MFREGDGVACETRPRCFAFYVTFAGLCFLPSFCHVRCRFCGVHGSTLALVRRLGCCSRKEGRNGLLTPPQPKKKGIKRKGRGRGRAWLAGWRVSQRAHPAKPDIFTLITSSVLLSRLAILLLALSSPVLRISSTSFERVVKESTVARLSTHISFPVSKQIRFPSSTLSFKCPWVVLMPGLVAP